ncbi:hypothetical protein OVY01_17440 [Robbsia sp. Bb-Pol-6]|uniref:HPt domain-containing protein n=1 Tax=Robbsia betulipollinis TaxID=2981849 RepID=A0ABT3ZR00_9BURK|nr:hypothetical protein [Robbsia betulipollinis]MCY0388961.1 hypothetical protein [Robbsia betulipollinis]
MIDTMDRDIALLRSLTDLSPSPRITRDIAAMLHRIQGATATMRWQSMTALVERARKQMKTGDGDGIVRLIAFWRRKRRVWLRDTASPPTSVDDRRKRTFRPAPDS